MTNNFPALPLIRNCMLINSPQASNGYSGYCVQWSPPPTNDNQLEMRISQLICTYSQTTSSMNKVLFILPVQQIFNPRHTNSMNKLYRQEWYTKIADELIYGQEWSSLRSLLFPYFFSFNIYPTFSKLQEKVASTQLPSGYPCVTRLSYAAWWSPCTLKHRC